MRIWRALKALGCAALRDGNYLLPNDPAHAEALRELGDECTREGGSAWLMNVTPDAAEDDMAYRQLFDRSEPYAQLRAGWKSENRGLRSLSAADLARLRRRSEKEFEALRAVDYFPSEASVEAEAAWTDFSKRIDALLSPDEPRESKGNVPRVDPSAYRGRTWATRRRLWVDRVASAWLIRRFIDPRARFRFAAGPDHRPRPREVRFDMFQAEFTHDGDLCTFEVLLQRFGVEDEGLRAMAEIVHDIDLKVTTYGRPETVGVDHLVAGVAWLHAEDEARLTHGAAVFDALHAYLTRKRR